ncbi:MAG: hypothetical protein H8E31_07290, partial [Planctomycetes bacterium]|nr:hypothetical protein [Planctomycetota bacterium]
PRWQLRRELGLALGPRDLPPDAPAGSPRFRRPAVESRGSFDDSLYGMLLPSRWDGAIYRDSDRLLLAPRPEKGTTAAVQMKKLREETVSFDAVPEGEFRLACWDELTGYRQSEPVQVHGEVVEVELGRLVRGSRILVETEGMDFGAGMLSIGVLNLETGWFPPAKFLRPTGSAVFDEVPPGRYQAYWGRLGRTSRVLGFSDPFLVDAEAGLTVPMAARASLARSCPLIARGSR